MISCTRKIDFDAAHRIINHESKCKMLHGHRYVLEVTFGAPKLDSLGRVIDFGVIKDILKNWIDENFDHNTILSIQDKKLGDEISKITGQKIYYINENPTAENIGDYLAKKIIPQLFINEEVKLTNLRIYETPNCFVDVK
jgi:6-pyruvoyltetrahydropterin/6-carboxytetrahydropterin synthase